jgi:5-deoxy-5-amino-3-dehydroquinate synthase
VSELSTARTPDAGELRATPVSVSVDLSSRSYDVLIGPGVRHELATLLPRGAKRAFVVTQAGIPVDIDPGMEHVSVEIGRGERSKSLATVEELGRAMARFGLSRSDVVIGLGGGLVTDVAGFAAATWHRGTAVVHVPTTVLGQVDAAIGGKTGVNLPEGKNLVGSFWQPHAVICDTDVLTTLPPEEWRSGYGEIAKYAFIGVEGLTAMTLTQQIAACVALKASVVESDERESGARMVLNYGHTLAHALEALGLANESAPGSGRDGDGGGGDGDGEGEGERESEGAGDGEAAMTLRHGEAVAVGLVFAARLAEALGRIDSARVAEHRRVVNAYGLSTALPSGAPVDELLEYMRRDKKAERDLSFVLDGPAGVELVKDVDARVVRAVLSQMAEEATS